MKLNDLAGKRILLLGFGKEGKSTLRYLKHFYPDSAVDTADENGNEHALDSQKDYDLAIRSPGVLPRKITIPYTTATNIFFANTKGITIGVTGTKGKSTTSSLVYEILKRDGKPVNLGGNIGIPLLDLLLNEGPRDYYVCELSSYQIEDLEYSPHIAVFLDFFPEHMDHHGSIEDYWKASQGS